MNKILHTALVALLIGSNCLAGDANYTPKSEHQILDYEAFSTGFDDKHMQPAWISYRLKASELSATEDLCERVETKPVSIEQNEHSGDYRLGNLAPVEDFNHCSYAQT